jgi:predicted GH43/DUF377 family glycosyl hydrolase
MQWIKKGLIYDDFHAQVPIVDTQNLGFWRVYFSKRIKRGPSLPYFIDVEAGNPSNILFKSTEPILLPGERGTFDWAGVMPTEILTIGSTKYLFYIGWANRHDVPYHNNLGLATSSDGGQSWQKISEGPVFATSYREPGYVGTISIIESQGQYYGYYLSCRKWQEIDNRIEPIYDIKIAISDNLIDWMPINKTAIELSDDEGGISKASIFYLNKEYYMCYAVRKKADYRANSENSYRIKCAKSSDLLHWEKIDALGLDISSHESWDNQMVEYPHIFEYKDDLYMFYNGNGFGESGFGYAQLSK